MCGIAGYTGTDDRQWLGRMNASLLHRGPDDGGEYHASGDRVHLGMRRLAIVDVAEGAQPMSIENGAYWIVYNGELFNAPELRRELEVRGRAFATDHSDTEVLLHLYALEGERMVERLNGMFSFVIHDTRRRLLFGARDHCGIKPFFYTLHEGKIAFASEIKALIALPWIDRAIDHQAVSDYLSFQAIPSPKTIYRHIRKLSAGSSFTYLLSNSSLNIRRYWSLPVDRYRHRPLSADPREYPQHIRQAFDCAVKRWSMSDVPVAYSLSGGIDSSAVVGASAKLLGRRLQTYTLGFGDALDIDERALARTVASRYGTDHHEIVLSEDQLIDDLPAMAASLDEPYAGSVPSWFIYKEMGKHVKVAMTGTGGDELFGNYRKWLVSASLRKWLHRTKTFFRHEGGITDLLRHPHGALHYPYFTDRAKRRTVLQPEFLNGVRPSTQELESLWRSSPDRDPKSAVAFVDFQLQLPEEFLMMTDRFSMAHSLEARTPLLDIELIETVCRIPPGQRTNAEQPKGLFVKAVEDLLPPELLSAPKKGFVLPTGRWLRTKLRPLVEQLLSPEYVKNQNIFSAGIVTRYVRPHMEGERDNGELLWTLLMFQLWYEKDSRSRT